MAKTKTNGKRETEKTARTSAPIAEEQIQRLREIFPEAFTEGQVDFGKLRETLGDAVDDRPERYSFTWAGKKDSVRILQMPSRATLTPAKEESVNFDTTQNLFIEGDNLEVLKLLYKPYHGRVKMIYIDPPYNTGNDFIYPDNYADPLDTYLRISGQKDGNGNLLTSNLETNGRYHSAWLSMVYPRLFLARQLLREDGVIFVSIDDNEAHNLRAVMDEIFGEENVDVMIWRKSGSGRYGKMKNISTFRKDHEYVIVAYKQIQNFFKLHALPDFENDYGNPDDDPRGNYKAGSISLKEEASDPDDEDFYSVTSPAGKIFTRQFDIPREEFEKLNADKRIYWGKKGDAVPAIKIFIKEKRYVTPSSMLLNVGSTYDGTTEFNDIFKEVSSKIGIALRPKPTTLIQTLTQLSTTSTDLILDFFSGSCTTAQAVMELNREDGGNRRFICVQLPEPMKEDSEARKAGYKTIADIGKERIRRVLKKLHDKAPGGERETPEDLGFKVFKLTESNFRHWKGVEDRDPEKWAEEMELFNDPLLPGWKPEDVLYETAVKEGYGLNIKIEKERAVNGNAVWRVSDPDKGQSFRACLDDKIPAALLKKLGLQKDELFICRDAALDDETAANLSLQCRLKTI